MSTIRIRLVDRVVRVDDPVGITHLEDFLVPFRIDARDAPEPDQSISVRVEDGRFECYLESGESPYFDAETQDDFLLLMERTLINLFLRYLPGDVPVFHGAGFYRQGHLVGFLGGSGAGKSTLASTHLDRGWKYVSDELIALNPEGLTLYPFPKPLSLDPEAVPSNVETITVRDSEGTAFFYGLPGADAVQVTSAEVESVIFYDLNRRAGTEAKRVPVQKGQKFLTMSEHLLRPEESNEKFRGLSDLKPEALELYRLHYSDVEDLESIGLLPNE